MALSLEDRLRQLAKAGELTYLSIVPCAGPGGVVFHASWSPASQWGSGMGRDADPVTAIFNALDDDRMTKLVKKLKSAESPDPPPLDLDAEFYDDFGQPMK